MFIEDADTIQITVKYVRKNYIYDAHTEKEFKELELGEEESKKYNSVIVTMKQMNWGLYNELQEDAMVDSGTGSKEFNFKVFKENRLKKLITGWDAKDKEGKLVPVSSKAIKQMAPAIPEAILRAYDEISFLDEEEEKN